MRKVGMLAVTLMSLSAVSLWACVDRMSPYSVGVIFSNGEVLYPERIESAAQDDNSYLKACTLMEASQGRRIFEGGRDSCSTDPLTVKQVTVSLNTLLVEVQYGGGCKYHAIEMYTDKALLKSNPAQLNLWLSHDGNGDNCEALISETIKFDLSSMGIVQNIILHVYAPGASEPFGNSPLWSPVSGLKTQQCSYKLRSAYAENVMAHIGYFDGPFQNGDNGFRVLLVFDTASVPSAQIKAAAMVAELKRLAAIGVLSQDASFIAHVGAALARNEGQYWTAEDTVLGFNMWFDGSSVNGVKGVYGARGCGSGVTYELPEIELVPVGVAPSQLRIAPMSMAVVADVNGLTARFSPVANNGSSLSVVDMQGREIVRRMLNRGATNCTLSRSEFPGAAGFYTVSVVHHGRIVQSRTVVLTMN